MCPSTPSWPRTTTRRAVGSSTRNAPPLCSGPAASPLRGPEALPAVAPADTTHIDSIDAEGNMGSRQPRAACGWLKPSPLMPELGFPFGTRAQQFNLQPGHPKRHRPRQAAAHDSSTPSLVLRDGAAHMVFGTEGGDNQGI